MKAALDRPASGLHRVAERVDGGIIEIDAALEEFVVTRSLACDIGRGRAGIDTADQKPLAAAGGEELQRVGDPRGSAGQHNDTVGVAVEDDFLVRQQPKEGEKAETKRDEHKQHKLAEDRADPSP